MVPVYSPPHSLYHLPEAELWLQLEGYPLCSSGCCRRTISRGQNGPEMITSISDILSTLPVNNRVKEYGLWKSWDKMVGQNVARHCQPDRLKDGILFLKVNSSVWMQQLQFMKSIIIDKVNGFMGDNSVRDVRFQIGKLENLKETGGKPWKEISLPQEVVARIDMDLSSVRDTELRRILKKLRVKEAQVKAWRDQSRKGTSSAYSPS